MARTTYTVRGTLAGALWWPVGVRATKTVEHRSAVRPDSLTDLVEEAIAGEDGDFSDAPRFMADAVLTIIRWRSDGRGHHSRSWYLDSLPSLAEYVLAELPTYADGEED